MAIAGQKVKMEQILLATIADELNGLLFARKGVNEKPKSLLALLLNINPKDEKKCLSFKSAKSFEEWWNTH